MTLEQTLSSLLEAKLAPLCDEVSRLREQLAAVRGALPSNLVTMREAAERLGVSVATVRRQVKAGRLPVRRIGRALRIDLDAAKPPSEDDVARKALSLVR